MQTSLGVECFTYTWLTSVCFEDTDGEGNEWGGPGFRFKALLLIVKAGVFEGGRVWTHSEVKESFLWAAS